MNTATARRANEHEDDARPGILRRRRPYKET